MDIKAVVFDMDDTLVANKYPFSKIKDELKEYLAAQGVNRSVVAGLTKVLEGLEEIAGHYPERKWEFYEKLEELEVKRARESFVEPKVIQMLKDLRAMGLKNAVVTRNCRAGTDVALEPVKDLVDLVLTREDVERPKPDPEHILMALRILDVPPENTLVVGDFIFDIMAGRRAGCVTAGINIPDADYNIQHVTDIMAIINS